jgi:acetyl esterase/lipase
LISPLLDLSRDNKGFEEQESQDKLIPEQFVEWFLNLYIPEGQDRKNPLLSPYWLDPKHLQTLPSSDILYGEFDRFRGDSEQYSRKLTQQGTPNCLFMFPQENHGLLWNNLAVINTISARLMLTFHSEIAERPISNEIMSLSFFRFHRASRSYQYEKIEPEAERKIDRAPPDF